LVKKTKRRKIMEKDFSHKIMNRLQKYFFVFDEVWSRCGKYRIDFVINDRKNDDVFFGIEFKDFKKNRGEEIGEHILQAIRYSLSEFEISPNVFRRIPIMLCPPISYIKLISPEHETRIIAKSDKTGQDREYFHDRHTQFTSPAHHTVNGMLGVLNIGEVRTLIQRGHKKIYFSFSNKKVWSEESVWEGGRLLEDSYRGIDFNCYEKLTKYINRFSL
jgi:phage anti-repressor protein